MMEELPNLLDDAWDNLKVVSRCPICNSKYSAARIEIIEKKDDAHLVCIKCKNCQTTVVAVVLANPLGVSTIGLVTDLDSNDIVKFRNQQPLSFDDALNFHQELKARGMTINDFL